MSNEEKEIEQFKENAKTFYSDAKNHYEKDVEDRKADKAN